MAHYVSGRLPYQLPRRPRPGVGNVDYQSAEAGAWLPINQPMHRATTRPMPAPRSRTAAPQKKKTRRALQHGDTKYCVVKGRGSRKKVVACYRSKADAQKRAKRERLKKVGKAGIYVRPTKHELTCKKGSQRVCRTRKKGSRVCKTWGCAKK